LGGRFRKLDLVIAVIVDDVGEGNKRVALVVFFNEVDGMSKDSFENNT